MDQSTFVRHITAETAKVRFEEMPGGVTIAHIENDSATASISLFGGQVLTWQPKRAADPVLWMSQLAKFDAKTAIRGGVPICWPWFGKHPSAATAPSHGYARLCAWELDRITSLGDGRTEVVMSLPQSAQSGDHRLADLSLSARVLIGDALEVALTTNNKSPVPVHVTEGLHTYFHVSDIADVQVTGLNDCEYVDLIDNDRRRHQAGAIDFAGEVGRVFVSCDRTCTIEDRHLGRVIRVASTGSQSVAVWNPGLNTASKMADLGSEGWRTMVCVETANALENALVIAPGQEHATSAVYTVAPLA